ncbi:hypothetical protein BDC45DRAFT_180073 [Circinella umbellata]|nr:hypothetical protein BDC45DRAFT_180073 [Circinella umbellata]
MGNISIVDIQNTLSNRLRDLQLKQNFQPLRNTLSRAVSGGAKAVSTGGSRLFRGMDALWNEFERGMNEETPRRSSVDTVHSNASGQTRHMVDHNRRWSSINETPSQSTKITKPSSSSKEDATHIKQPTSPLESSTQQAGRLFSSFSSFLSRKQKEISQVMEDSMATEAPSGHIENNNKNYNNNSRSPVSRTASLGAMSDDDSSSAFVDVGAMYSFSPTSTNSNNNNNNNSTIPNQTKKKDQSQDNMNDNLEKKKNNNDDGPILDI